MSSSPNHEAACDKITADISKIETYEDRIRKFEPDIVIHAAWLKTHNYSLDTSIDNLASTIKFLQLCFSLNSVKKIIGLGSCLEYGDVNSECLEDLAVIPNSYFSWCKDSIRKYCEVASIAESKKFNWFRIFYAYGPNQRAEALIPTAIRTASNHKDATARNPHASLDLIHVYDIANAVDIATQSECSGVFNLGSGISYNNSEIMDKINHMFKGKDYKIRERRFGMRSNNDKISNELGWKPTISLDKGLRELIELEK